MKIKRSTKAQTITEYMLLLCLLGVGLIPIVSTVSKVLQDQLEVSAHRIAGNAKRPRSAEHLNSSEEKVDRGLDDFWKK